MAGLLVIQKLRAPEIIFAKHIARKILGDGSVQYFIRYLNIGYNDFTECRRFAKLNINTSGTGVDRKGDYSAYLKVGDADIIPAIEGHKRFH